MNIEGIMLSESTAKTKTTLFEGLQYTASILFALT